eukprot:2310802-Prymnesium_polylepis.1
MSADPGTVRHSGPSLSTAAGKTHMRPTPPAKSTRGTASMLLDRIQRVAGVAEVHHFDLQRDRLASHGCPRRRSDGAHSSKPIGC